jgi:hypothetical protein
MNTTHTLSRKTLVLLVTVGLVAAGAFVAWRMVNPSQAATMTSAEQVTAIEDKYGVRITLVALTADQGLVDLRYLITDPDKASDMMASYSTLPVIIAEDSGAVINLTRSGQHQHRLRIGQMFYTLYYNSKGALKPGSLATVQFGQLRIEHITVQ